jgi:hypothetical protein
MPADGVAAIASSEQLFEFRHSARILLFETHRIPRIRTYNTGHVAGRLGKSARKMSGAVKPYRRSVWFWRLAVSV